MPEVTTVDTLYSLTTPFLGINTVYNATLYTMLYSVFVYHILFFKQSASCYSSLLFLTYCLLESFPCQYRAIASLL